MYKGCPLLLLLLLFAHSPTTPDIVFRKSASACFPYFPSSKSHRLYLIDTPPGPRRCFYLTGLGFSMPTLPSPFARVYNIEPILSLIPSHQWQWHRLPVHRLQFFFLAMRSSYTANSLIPSIEEVQQFNCLATNRLPGKLPLLQHLPLLVKGTPRAWIHYTEHVIPFHSSFVRFLRGPNWIISTAIDRCRSISDIFLWARPWKSVGGLFTANTGPWYNARGRRLGRISNVTWIIWGSRNHK